MENRHGRSRRSAVALLTALALIAASCGSDGGSSTGDDATATTAAPASTTTSDATDTTEPDTTEADATDEIVLTDSARGVTAEAITLGHTSIDFDRLNDDFNLDLAFVNNAPIADAIAGLYNDKGGVLGRQIELVHEDFLPVGSTTAEEVCVKLTQDATVFAVIEGFAGPGAVDVNECFTVVNDTILVGYAPTAEQAERAGGLWVSTDMSGERRSPAVARALAGAGLLSELGPIAVIAGSQADQAAADAMAEEFRSEGTDVAFVASVSTAGDRIATAAEVGVWIERARASDVSTIVMLGPEEFRNQEFFIQAPELTYIMGSGETITDWQSIPPEGLETGTRILTSVNGPDVAAFDDPELVECIDAVEAALDIEVLATSQLPDGERNYFSGTVNLCRWFSMFIQIAEAAGPDLTNESWIAALDQVPDLSIPGFDFVSLSSDKIDVLDQLVLVEYDLETLSFNPISDPIDIG